MYVCAVWKVFCVCLPAAVLTQKVSTVHFCKSISDQSLRVLETLVLLYSLCMDQWAGMGGIVSGRGRRGGGELGLTCWQVKHESFCNQFSTCWLKHLKWYINFVFCIILHKLYGHLLDVIVLACGYCMTRKYLDMNTVASDQPDCLFLRSATLLWPHPFVWLTFCTWCFPGCACSMVLAEEPLSLAASVGSTTPTRRRRRRAWMTGRACITSSLSLVDVYFQYSCLSNHCHWRNGDFGCLL